jgi:ribokinase
MAHDYGVCVILDPAPISSIPNELYSLSDLITPIEIKYAMLPGFPIQNSLIAERATEILLGQGAGQVIIIRCGAQSPCRHRWNWKNFSNTDQAISK